MTNELKIPTNPEVLPDPSTGVIDLITIPTSLRQEIFEYLKNNLTIKINEKSEYSGNSTQVTVELYLEEELISEDSDWIYIPENCGHE